MTYSYREIHEYARDVRAVVNQPRTTLVRPDDLSWSASRLLRLTQMLKDTQPDLCALIEGCLGDIAALQPDRAVERVRAVGERRPQDPVVWALACHVLAQILSEYSSEASAETVTDLRGSLGEWFGKLQQAIEDRGLSADEATLVCLQAMVGQCALFHDADALDWASGRLLFVLAGGRLGSDVRLQCAALAAGLVSGTAYADDRARLTGLLDEAGKENPEALKIRELLGGVVHSVDLMKSSMEAVRRGSQSTKAVPRAGAGKKRKKPGVSLAAFWESVAGWIPWLLVVGVLGGCLWGAGLAWDWLEGTAPVGNQTLKDSYAQMRAQNEARREREEAEANAPAIPESDPGYSSPDQGPGVPDFEAAPPEPVTAVSPTPRPTAIPTPEPTPDIRETALSRITQRDAGRMRARVRLQRSVVPPTQAIVPGVQPRNVRVWGEYIRTEPVYDPATPQQATVKYWVNWFEDGSELGLQWIDSRYEWTGETWEMTAAARCLNRQNAEGLLVYVLDDVETRWAKALFERNPFYDRMD